MFGPSTWNKLPARLVVEHHVINVLAQIKDIPVPSVTVATLTGTAMVVTVNIMWNIKR